MITYSRHEFQTIPISAALHSVNEYLRRMNFFVKFEKYFTCDEPMWTDSSDIALTVCRMRLLRYRNNSTTFGRSHFPKSSSLLITKQ